MQLRDEVQTPAIIYILKILNLQLNRLVFIVKAETSDIKKQDNISEKVGEKNQERRIYQSFFQPMSSVVFQPTRPAPIIAPTTVCVPDIGMPVNEAAIMKVNETKHTVNIILYSLPIETVVED